MAILIAASPGRLGVAFSWFLGVQRPCFQARWSFWSFSLAISVYLSRCSALSHCSILCNMTGTYKGECSQLGRPDFAACKIWWKHIAQCLNLASHFTSSKTLIFNKGFACTNVYWNLYIVFIAIHYVLHCILPYAEHVQHLKSGHMQNVWFYFEFCSQYLPSCYMWNMTNGFHIM